MILIMYCYCIYIIYVAERKHGDYTLYKIAIVIDNGWA